MNFIKKNNKWINFWIEFCLKTSQGLRICPMGKVSFIEVKSYFFNKIQFKNALIFRFFNKIQFRNLFICECFNKIQFKILFICKFFDKIQFKILLICNFFGQNSIRKFIHLYFFKQNSIQKFIHLLFFLIKFNSKIYSKCWNWLYSIQ